jgi:hypothetical protein
VSGTHDLDGTGQREPHALPVQRREARRQRSALVGVVHRHLELVPLPGVARAHPGASLRPGTRAACERVDQRA